MTTNVEELEDDRMSRHGGPNDRGAADAYYGRPYNPHYYKGGTYTSEEVPQADMSEAAIADYKKGYDDTVASGDRKDYG